MAKVKITHPLVGESEVLPTAVNAWLSNGWSLVENKDVHTVSESYQVSDENQSEE